MEKRPSSFFFSFWVVHRSKRELCVIAVWLFFHCRKQHDCSLKLPHFVKIMIQTETIYDCIKLITCTAVKTNEIYENTVVFYIFTTFVHTSIHLELERALGRAHTFAYHNIGHWIMNMLALVACQLDRNWPLYGKNKILTFSWPWPWPLTRSILKSNQMVPV